MRAFVVTGPRESAVLDVEPPTAGAGQVVVDVHRAGVCGTDVEFFTGGMAYLQQGHASYPLRPGHEWCGAVASVGEGVDQKWLGRRVTGDTMLGCGSCYRCLDGRQHLCELRYEIGVRGGWPGALAEQLLVPVTALSPLPDSVDDIAGAMVEPGGNALRSVLGARLSPGRRVLILGPGTIGLLCVQFALATGAEVHVAGRSARNLGLARTEDPHRPAEHLPRKNGPGVAFKTTRSPNGTSLRSWVTCPGFSSDTARTPSSFIVRMIWSRRISMVRSTPGRPPAMRPYR